ncbi:MAG: Epoxyqueuosine reductase QueG (queuosine biosynthesis) [Chloroflexi bacterium AL-W]|nr:Epoxyqueuosine reductase QueG (queuosine biosynthesis) [Chloroflexi bacterium AL-N1]NOK67826.1 Epoxyqueuosine reductase QueG (queuosine biosynthesis) [Chloroflexi bacterium AL-N10]NOK75404.1 Epoxyqueuosine reductase QueG (queuosine biosynthesis) [Chloroflexi bacterium AL-N5]NOK82192.1 Epoxyqueuosine reductase QueG (queuosine biosynthesis) [Chloroflexi bacterium AL-W]NOK90037.1 Epoxyqueuosine reductase QueG (queuosine biosynthesis) [Chloroflexi bacterium AL-N15]
MYLGPASLVRRRYAQAKKTNSVVWLDSLANSAPLPYQAKIPSDQPGDIDANRSFKSRKSKVMKQDSYPQPTYAFAYQNPPVSGNVINGLGETARRRPWKIFHSGDFQIAWSGLERLFRSINTFPTLQSVLRTQWIHRKKIGPIAPQQVPVTDPVKMAHRIKNEARRLGASLVGITAVSNEVLFEGVDFSYKHAICIAIPMEREEMLEAPSETTNLCVLEGYYNVADVAIKLAEYIRAMGWPARTSANLGVSEVLHVPLAIRAGLGQLGKHGSIITREFGSNVRLAVVLTDLPLTHDEPVDIGVDDFCKSCQICVTNCPPQAIFDTKQMVRGDEKWFVNFDKCVPYFVANEGCAICIEVCPWSEPGQGVVISQKMLQQRARLQEQNR